MAKRDEKRWLYKTNQKAIEAFLGNVTQLYLTDVHVRKSGRSSKSEIKRLLRGSKQAFLTTDGSTLWIVVTGPDGSVRSLRFDKNEGLDTTGM